MGTREVLLKEQERERQVMQGASVETIICGRAYTWLEPSARDRRLMLGDVGGIYGAIQNRDTQVRSVMLALNFLVDWHPEIAKDQAAIDAKVFGATADEIAPRMKEIMDAFRAVVELVNRPFVKTKEPPAT
jgi:hypothetical protein